MFVLLLRSLRICYDSLTKAPRILRFHGIGGNLNRFVRINRNIFELLELPLQGQLGDTLKCLFQIGGILGTCFEVRKVTFRLAPG
jgi:hypothetical protein